MGTRADFYVGRGPEAEWLGSIGWDGYPEGVGHKTKPAGQALLRATTEAEYRAAVEQFFVADDGATRPNDGWPWPWPDSRTTDFAYAFDDGKVVASCYGRAWFDPLGPAPEFVEGAPKVAIFPNMSDRANVTLDSKRSGLMTFVG